MAFLKPEPRTLRERLAAITRDQWRFALASILVTSGVMTGFLLESRSGYEYAMARSRVRFIGGFPDSAAFERARTGKREPEARPLPSPAAGDSVPLAAPRAPSAR
ncbi:MAG: hypothetical protein RQ833_08485 [Sphingomonadaceae bacterium]|nr:hypothetical protein [Sphingomonadaceae bacterium]